MKNCARTIAASLGLAALLAVPALGAEVPVKDYTVPVDLTGEGAVWCARYDEQGKMLSLRESGDPAADAGEAEGAAWAKIFQLNGDMEPLAGAQAVYFTGWRERQQYGDLLAGKKKYDQAAQAYTQAIELDGAQALPYVGRGDARILGGAKAKDLTEDKLAASQADYETAKTLDPACAGAWLGLADVSIREGNIDGDGGAKEILEEGLAATGNAAPVQAKLDEIVSGAVSDSSGKEHRHSYFEGIKGLVWYIDTVYDAQGRKKTVTSYDGSGQEICHIDCLYDGEGRRVVYQTGTVSDGSLVKSSYDYDELGRIISRVKQVWEDGRWLEDERDTYEYTDEGRTVTTEKRIPYLWNGTDIFKTVSVYNGEDQRIRYDLYDSDGNLAGRNEYEYNAAGDQTLKKIYENGALIQHEEYDYNEGGKRTELREYDQDTLVRYTQWDYNGQGKETEERRFTVPEGDETGTFAVTWRATTEYSEDGRDKLRWSCYGDGKNLSYYEMYTYENHRLVKSEVYEANGTLVSAETYT